MASMLFLPLMASGTQHSLTISANQDNGKAVVMHEIVQAEQDQTERSDDEITKDIGVFDQVRKLIDGHKNLQKCALWARLGPENISRQ